MELRARILLIISISSLILYLSVEGFNILPSIVRPNSKVGGFDEPSRPILGPEEARKTIAPVTSSFVNEAETISSSVFRRDTKVASPVPTPFSGPGSLRPGLAPSPFSGPAPYPNLPFSPSLGPVPGPSPFSGPAPYPNLPSPGSDMSPASSPFSGPNPPLSPGSGLGPAASPFSGPSSPGSAPGPSPSGFIDHDVALVIESRIKQSQSDAQSAMDEAKKLLKDPNMASSETGKCLSKCVDKYGASLNKLNRAIADLGVRDVTLLADDFGAVEVDISTCQACFAENIGEDSPLKSLEEATMKAVRECLTVMDYAA
ncbi:putative pectinesterase inhibitor domain-containing protein [Helianthus annuus]|nr:putative pectinesterase inhibitor domain-containing protein [Helianthus annuus]